MLAGFSPVDFDELADLDSEAKIRRVFRGRIDAFIDALNALPVGRTVARMIRARYPGAKRHVPQRSWKYHKVYSRVFRSLVCL